MKIGLVGKPNCGKSTMFKALTEKDVEIASYPFTTIQPNLGVAFVTQNCPCTELGVKCNPQNSKCIDGIRLIPVNILDVAGLVPGASEGKGLGNQFLDRVREASVLIHVLDMSGSLNEKGEPAKNHDPALDKEFIEEEIDQWFFSIFNKNWSSYSRKIHMQDLKIEDFLSNKFSSLGITKDLILNVLRTQNLSHDPENWDSENLKNFVIELRKKSKPMIYACNKIDTENSSEFFENLKRSFPNELFIPTSAESELALKLASKKNIIRYIPGSNSFEIIGNISESQKKALQLIKKRVLEVYGSTGVQKVLNEAVFNLLNYIVVYPVEDEIHFSDKRGNILPDAVLLKKGSTALDLAYKIHTDLGDSFIKAIDAKTHRVIGKEQELKNRDIIKIVT